MMETFTDIYVLDLHGNKKKEEVCPDGSEDKNVFDIQQGVSIGIFVCEPGREGECRIHHGELWGARKHKYEWLYAHKIKTTDWNDVIPDRPFYLFKPQDEKAKVHWDEMISITKAMTEHSLGLITKRDNLVTAFSETELVRKLDTFLDPVIPVEEAVGLFGVKLKDKDKWDAEEVRRTIGETKGIAETIQNELYRPFDYRAIVYHKLLVARLNQRVLQHFSRGYNIGLILGRQGQAVSSGLWDLVIVTCKLTDQNIFRRGGGTIFPTYLYPTQGLFQDTGGNWEAGTEGRIPNFDKNFVAAFSERVGLGFVSDGRGDLKKTFGPEDLFDYIYGVFHCPTYRSRYAEFLKIDFPRVPLPRDCELFRSVARLGGELVGLHLMESDVLDAEGRGPEFNVEGDMTVAKGYPKYEVGQGRVYINEKQYFAGVEEAVWDFHVGGYQVCEKWLKDRRGRVLSYDDVSHYQEVAMSLGETIRIMGGIDETIDGLGGWPIDE